MPGFKQKEPLIPIREANVLLNLGLKIFPCHGVVDGRCTCGDDGCKSPGKHPATRRGFLDAVDNLAAYQDLLCGRSNLNIAAATSGALFVVDIDPRNNGVAAWASIVKELGIERAVDRAPQVSTGGGGRHIFFYAPGGTVPCRTNFWPGVDIKGAGGYVVAPPSTHSSGGTYSWSPNHSDDHELVLAPAALLDRLTASTKTQSAPADVDLTDGIPEGTRNVTLFKTARGLRARGLGAEAIAAAVRSTNATACRPPLDDKEVDAIVQSALTQPDRPDFAAAEEPEQPDFCGFADVEAVRDVLARLQAELPRDITLAYKPEFIDAAAALQHFDVGEYEALRRRLKDHHVRLTEWDRVMRERSHQEEQERGPSASRKPSQATQLVLLGQQAELFHDGDNCFATVHVDQHIETYPLLDKTFKRWMAQQFFVANGAAASSDAIGAAVNTLAGFARTTQERKPFVRIGGHDGRIFLDLGNSTWQVVEIDGAGWRMIEARDCPIRFRRRHGLLALPAPVRGGNLQELRELVNIPEENEWKLYVGFLVAALRNRGPYPILFIVGGAGCAKSTISLFTRNLIDPNLAPLRHPPRSDHDFMISASNSWFTCLNNVSFIPAWLSDGLCCLSTGGGFATRTLYENEDENLFDVRRPALLNSIVHVIRNGDLLDRLVVVNPPAIEERQRRVESEILAAYEAAQPRILGALLDAVSCAIRRLPEIKLAKPPRMADFAVWVEAAAPALGWQPGEFLAAYASERKTANDLVLEGAVAQAIIELTKPWEGTATELLEKLNELVTEQARRAKGWPIDGERLANALRRLTPNLQVAGIDVTFSRGGRRGRIIKITGRVGSGDADGGGAVTQKDRAASPLRRRKVRQDRGLAAAGAAGDAGMCTLRIGSHLPDPPPRKKFGK